MKKNNDPREYRKFRDKKLTPKEIDNAIEFDQMRKEKKRSR